MAPSTSKRLRKLSVVRDVGDRIVSPSCSPVRWLLLCWVRMSAMEFPFFHVLHVIITVISRGAAFPPANRGHPHMTADRNGPDFVRRMTMRIVRLETRPVVRVVMKNVSPTPPNRLER